MAHEEVAMVFSGHLHYNILICYSKIFFFIFSIVQWSWKDMVGLFCNAEEKKKIIMKTIQSFFFF